MGLFDGAFYAVLTCFVNLIRMVNRREEDERKCCDVCRMLDGLRLVVVSV